MDDDCGRRVGPFCLFAMGFRPFYLAAGAYASVSLPLWVTQYLGVLAGTHPLWHQHEMVFGYAFAVLAGFLFTAVRNWTGLPTPTGPALAAIVALWIGARALALLSLPAAAWLDAGFAASVAWGIGRPLVASGNRRNLIFAAAVLALGALSAAFPYWPGPAAVLALGTILFVMSVIAGRVVPMFTNNAVPGASARRLRPLEPAALAAVAALPLLDVLGLASGAAAVSLAAAGLHALRLWFWQPWRTLGQPILWILHLSYGWIVVHLLLRGLAGFDLVAEPLAIHALTVGAIGGLTLGMMTRTARGHTARALRAGRTEVAAYVLVQLAAAVRVVVPLALPPLYVASVVTSAILWTLAFALFTAVYAPILARPRLDGKPG